MPETETLEEKIIRTWKANPDIQAEFMGDFQAYMAYCEADAAKKVRIQGR